MSDAVQGQVTRENEAQPPVTPQFGMDGGMPNCSSRDAVLVPTGCVIQAHKRAHDIYWCTDSTVEINLLDFGLQISTRNGVVLFLS